MNSPKLIFRYTHAQAVENGELRILKPRTLEENMNMPIYVGYQLDEQLKKHGISDDLLHDAINLAFGKGMLNKNWRRKKRFTCRYLAVPFDVVLSELIQDEDDEDYDDEEDECMTLVLEGES